MGPAVRRRGLLDKGGASYVEGGYAYVSASDEDWLEKLAADPGLLLLPLARCGTDLAVGDDVEAWERFVTDLRG